MVFGKKKIVEKVVEEVPVVESPVAEEIETTEDIMEEVPEEEEPVELSGEASNLDNELNIVIGQIQSRITNVEATLYRLLNR